LLVSDVVLLLMLVFAYCFVLGSIVFAVCWFHYVLSVHNLFTALPAYVRDCFLLLFLFRFLYVVRVFVPSLSLAASMTLWCAARR
jgi:hypothetical protein